jgi:hypothetical protein
MAKKIIVRLSAMTVVVGVALSSVGCTTVLEMFGIRVISQGVKVELVNHQVSDEVKKLLDMSNVLTFQVNTNSNTDITIAKEICGFLQNNNFYSKIDMDNIRCMLKLMNKLKNNGCMSLKVI